MKKIYLVLTLSVLFGIGSSQITCVPAFAAYDEGSQANNKLGHPGTPGDPVRVYTLVRNPMFTATAQAGGDATYSRPLSNGDAVLWDLTSDDGVTINIIGEGGISVSNDAVAGVVVGAIPTADVQGNTAVQDVGHRNWGFIQVYGLHAAAFVDASAITAGDSLRLSATTRRLGTAQFVGINFASTGNRSAGFAFDTSSAVGSAEVFVATQ